MTRTQIRLPDALHLQAKGVAERHEISLAELVRRGLEHMIRLYRVDQETDPGWRLPEPLALGEFLAPVEVWREIANATADTKPG